MAVARLAWLLGFFLFASSVSAFEVTVTRLVPHGIASGSAQTVTVHGTELPVPFRGWVSHGGAIEVLESHPDHAVLKVALPTLPAGVPAELAALGPAGLTAPIPLLVDPLPSRRETEGNTNPQNAMPATIGEAIDGTLDGPTGDHYSIDGSPGNKILLEVICQRLGSTADPVLAIIDPSGQPIQIADDREPTFDAMMTATIPQSGKLLLVIHENRYQAGGRYRLRILPESDSAAALPSLSESPSRWLQGEQVQERRSTPDESFVLSSPSRLIGTLDSPQQIDRYEWTLPEKTPVWIDAKSRSLGSPALLQLRVIGPDGVAIASANPDDSDELAIHFTTATAGVYRMEVSDLLGRGSNDFRYQIDTATQPHVLVQLKPDAKTRDRFLLEEGQGAVPIDFQVIRRGVDGPIWIRPIEDSLTLSPDPATIPAGAAEGRLWFRSPSGWKASDLAAVQWMASWSPTQPHLATRVTGDSLRRARLATSYVPAAANNGLTWLAGVADSPSFFVPVPPSQPTALDAKTQKLEISWTIQRPQADFKEPVTWTPLAWPSGWTMQSKMEGDKVTAMIERPIDSRDRPTLLRVAGLAEFQGKGRWEALDLPLQWNRSPMAAVRLEVVPEAISLVGRGATAGMVVTGLETSGRATDMTDSMQVTVADASIARWESGRWIALADGTTTATIQQGDLQSQIPIEVRHSGVELPISFLHQTLPALSKMNCNSGACHGSPSGKGGFRLSLRAFDSQLDQLTLIREDFGRRTNLQEPDKSLLLLKPLMRVAHGGGLQLRTSDPAYRVIRDWIAQGAKTDPADTPRPTGIEVLPAPRPVVRDTGTKIPLVVFARFPDGSRREITDLAAYESSDASIAVVDPRGIVSSRKRGEAVVLVRYLEWIEAIAVRFEEEVPGYLWESRPQHNFIDELVDAKLQQMQIAASPICSDSEFLRRSTLDVLGRLPTPEEALSFAADVDPAKRNGWIDHLLRQPEYASFWALKWGDLLRMTSKQVGDDAVYKYHRWLEQAFRENLPYDQFARTLLMATGSTHSNPPANFYRTSADRNDSVETFSQVFLGARLQCAKCHNHPFERWTQDNYYGLGVFFEQVQRKKTSRPNELVVWMAPAGQVVQPRTGQVMKPWLPQQGTLADPIAGDPRQPLVDWLLNPANPYFARIEANRIWRQCFSRGIVDPIDDFRDSNPPSNGPLLDRLAKELVDSKYDRRHLLKTILQSRTYQSSSMSLPSNREDERYFSHQRPRLLAAEPLLDAIGQVTGLPHQFAGFPAGTKATQIPGPDLAKVDFLKVLGKPERNSVCACERTEDSNLGMAIEFFNGQLLHEKLRNEQNRFRKAIAAGKSSEQVLEELYLSALARRPSPDEMKAASDHWTKTGDLSAAFEDICWALLNTDEFLFQH
ncbi:MAG: DUF1549 domain-containing protein [Pirellulaceae bacterium]